MNSSQHTAVWLSSPSDRVTRILGESFPDIQHLDAVTQRKLCMDVRTAISRADSTSTARKFAIVTISILVSFSVSAIGQWAQSNVQLFLTGLVVIVVILVRQIFAESSPLKLQRKLAQAITDTLDRYGIETDEMTCLAASERILGDPADSYWLVVYWILCGLLMFAVLLPLRDLMGISVKDNKELFAASYVFMFCLSVLVMLALYMFAILCWFLGYRNVSCQATRYMAGLGLATIRGAMVTFPFLVLADLVNTDPAGF